jgi:hypothetical protein
MLKKVIDRITEELVACEFSPNKVFRLAVQLQTFSKTLDFLPSYQEDDAFFAVFPEKETEEEHGEGGGKCST